MDVKNQESKRDHDEGGRAGLSRELGRDQEQRDGAGLSWRELDNPLLQLFLNTCFSDVVTLLRTAVETAVSEIRKLLGTGGVPTSLALFFWRWLTVSWSLWVGARGRVIEISLPPLPPPGFLWTLNTM